jgi:hypothetical protein
MPGLSLALERERHREQGSHQVWDYILLWMGYTGSCFSLQDSGFLPEDLLLVLGESYLFRGKVYSSSLPRTPFQRSTRLHSLLCAKIG